jgi:hypothetical protein
LDSIVAFPRFREGKGNLLQVGFWRFFLRLRKGRWFKEYVDSALRVQNQLGKETLQGGYKIEFQIEVGKKPARPTH